VNVSGRHILWQRHPMSAATPLALLPSRLALGGAQTNTVSPDTQKRAQMPCHIDDVTNMEWD